MKTSSMEHITFSVPGKKIEVPIYIGKGIFEQFTSIISLNKYSSKLVIIDENVYKHWSKLIHNVLGKDVFYYTVQSGEKNKTLATIEKIWTSLSKNGFDRKSLILNIGGGMVCDIGAFAASTFMRGIPFVQIPTTLLAQADAAIGGKTGFDFNNLKNTIGTFSSPLAVISDTRFLSTLPRREFRSGLAEIIKHAIISDNNLFEYLLNTDLASLRENELDSILIQSTNIKCEVVCKDPYERKERKKLNFGHTVGHAVEMVCNNELLHGEAVAIGMIAEARMSFLSGYISENNFREIENLISKAKLPNKVSTSYKNEILNKILFDKKNSHHEVKWVFLEDLGKIKVDVTLPDEIIEEGINYTLK